MKKRIVPLGKSILIYSALFLVLIGVSIFILLSNFTIFRLIILLILDIISLYYFIVPLVCYQIRVDNDTLSMRKDFGIFKEDRIQHEVSVDLKNIKSYKLVLSYKDSIGQAYSTRVSKRKYIEFNMISEKEEDIKRLYISCLHNKQILKLLEYIKTQSNIEISNE